MLLTAQLLALLIVTPTSLSHAVGVCSDETSDLEDFEARLGDLHSELIPRLEALVPWVRSKRLYAESDRLWEAILHFEPDHAEARRALRYRWFEGRGWVRSKSFHPGKNRAHDALAEFLERRHAAITPYRGALLALIDEHMSGLSLAKREELLTDMLLLEPNDVAVRAALGETRWRGRWVLTETAATLRRRVTIRGLARESLGVAPEPEPCEPGDLERATGLLRREGRCTPRVRVFGTVSPEEAADSAQVTHALADYFRLVFGRSQDLRADYTLYLLQGAQERDRVLASLPVDDEEGARLARSASGGWMAHAQVYGEWDADPLRRRDGAARQALGTLLRDAYGIEGRHGWAWEGLGLYLTYQILGTRRTYFFHGAKYAPNRTTTLWWELQLPQTDWLERGGRLLASDTAPALAYLLGLDVNNMRDEDLLVSYLLAAYLLEGRPDAVGPLLERIGKGAHPVLAFEKTLGFSLPQIEVRLRRWLEETRGAF